MSERRELSPSMVHLVEVMLEDGTIEGITRLLARQFPSLSDDVNDAVGHAIEKFVVLETVPRKPASYLAAMAANRAKAIFKKRLRETSLDALTEVDEDGNHWELPEEDWSVEERALFTVVYDQLRNHVESWDTQNKRLVTLLFLEAAFVGEPLSAGDAAELASEILGYEIDTNTVRTWKSRGFRDLQGFAKDNDLLS